MLGGAYLCFEGVEKLAHKWMHPVEDDHIAKLEAALDDPQIDMVAFEAQKIKGAVRTDFVLSAEIIVITLGTVALSPFSQQLVVVTLIALLMTVGVYGFVALIVKLDDIGLHLMQKSPSQSSFTYRLGALLLTAAPKLMKFLSIAGTVAMFLVGGGILSHNLAPVHHAIEALQAALASLPMAGLWQFIATSLADCLTGVLAGVLALLGVNGIAKLRKR
jgi:predicted DNA repair protein MutK